MNRSCDIQIDDDTKIVFRPGSIKRRPPFEAGVEMPESHNRIVGTSNISLVSPCAIVVVAVVRTCVSAAVTRMKLTSPPTTTAMNAEY